MVQIGNIIRSLFPEKGRLIDEGRCPICEERVNEAELVDELDRQEYSISGMCAACIHAAFSSCYDLDERAPYEGED